LTKEIVLGDVLDFVEFPDDISKLKAQLIGVRADIHQLRECNDMSEKVAMGSATRIDAGFRSSLVIQLSTITMLIDAKLISIEEAVSRIEQIHSSFAQGDPGYSTPMATDMIKRVTDWLRAHARKPARQWSADILSFPSRRDRSDDIV
jgi:hypothetical protein